MSDPDMAPRVIDLTKGIPPPEHPPPPGPEREQWTGWQEWDQHCRLVQQHTRLQQIGQFITPTLNYYYDLDDVHLGSINLPDIDFPRQPDLENYSYDEVHEYIKELYQKTLEVALPQSHNRKGNGRHTKQTTLGRYLSLYQPLQVLKSTSIVRLLDILPAATEDDTLSTRLFTADLDSSGLKYEALSYTWGAKSSTGKKYFIYVNGYKQSVTANLHSALSSLRHSSQSRTLWVDSICINQADVQERCHQVLLMARIYAGASKVLVYLGPSTPPSAALFRVLQSPMCNPATFYECNNDDDEGGDTDPAFWKMCHDAGPDLVEGFIDISSRSWWNRVWVLQEYILNKRDPVIYCGRFRVDNQVLSKNFQRLYSWVEHRRRHPVLLDDCHHPACDRSYIPVEQTDDKPSTSQAKDKGKQVAASDMDLKDIDPKVRRGILPPQGSAGREWTKWGRQVWKATSVMIRRDHCSPYSMPYYSIMGLQSQCTVPHDMVYGLRELMDALFRSLFPPDYMIPLSTLFTRFAGYILIVDMNVDMFWHFPHRLRDDTGRDPRLQTSGSAQAVPSWVRDFTKPRLVRTGDEPPRPNKKKTQVWGSTAHILDRVLFMNGILLDEIVDVFPLPLSDPFLLLQQLWYVERSFWEPRYLRDNTVESDKDSGNPKDEFEDMMHRLGGVTIYPSIAWATGDANRFTTDISIVDVINGLTNLGPLLIEPLESYMAKIPQVVDMIMERNQQEIGIAAQANSDEEPAEPDHLIQSIADLDLTSDAPFVMSSPSRDDLIYGMKSRFLELARQIAAPTMSKDLVGICTFDYDNFRSQVLHRLTMWSAQRVADTLGDRPGLEYLKEGLGPREETAKCAITHSPIAYKEYIDAIDEGRDPLEIRMREGFVIDLATKIHRATVDMVGLEGDAIFESVNVSVQQDLKNTKETSSRRVCMFPLLTSKGRKKRKTDQEKIDMIGSDLSLLNLPHNLPGHPVGSMSRWTSKPREDIHDVHHSLCDVVDFLAGRELFVTEIGLVGIAGVGTTGIQDGDDLLLLQGMSYPLIGRLEPLPELGVPKKRRREMPTKMMKREILGTAVVKGIDPKDGNLEEATMPSWFEDISGGITGRFRFG
ncbi:hypothetical protein AK830_g3785 [Neonectria ditissima]|uniref:Heterokaryon incompatibility domain-containing protein n=1 Tax=Neonectria ditissima TaxID=78410 RepID=A0A0P7B819_9HYPO|nr:hypothetical protein AK830_g3785 [Neonectria ditissima]